MRHAAAVLPARRRPPFARGVAVLSVLAALGAGAGPAGAQGVPAASSAGAPASSDPAVSGDPAVGEARDELDRARRLREELSADLDVAAEEFERAQAHHLRLVDERAGAEEALSRAEDDIAAARAAFAERVTDAYRHPEPELALSEAVLVAPDAGTALHRAALLETVRVHDARREDAEAARTRAAQRLRQRRILDAGTAGAAADVRGRADALAEAIADADARIADARANLADAEEEARQREAARRAAEERRAEEQRRAASAAGRAAATPPPAVGGKVCPVGTPNGFIDSWGFPRSGGRSHQGVDIFAPRGTPLYAVADGTVARLSNGALGGLGLHLVDDAGDRYYYAHLDTIAVARGQRVRAGDVVGTVGNTGNARTTPAHLHWQYHPDGGSPVNPFPLAHALCRG